MCLSLCAHRLGGRATRARGCLGGSLRLSWSPRLMPAPQPSHKHAPLWRTHITLRKCSTAKTNHAINECHVSLCTHVVTIPGTAPHKVDVSPVLLAQFKLVHMANSHWQRAVWHVVTP